MIYSTRFQRVNRPLQLAITTYQTTTIESNVYNIFDPIGLKLLTRLSLGCSHLYEHKFKHNFQDCLNPPCSCSLEIEDTVHITSCTAIIFLIIVLILQIV